MCNSNNYISSYSYIAWIIYDRQGRGKLKIIYENDGYKYAWEKNTKLFFILDREDKVIFSNENPIKVYAQYEIYISAAFTRRIKESGYNIMGELEE